MDCSNGPSRYAGVIAGTDSMPTLNFSGLLAILTGGAVLLLSFAQAGEPQSSPSVAADHSVAATATASTTGSARHEPPAPARSRGA